MRFILDAQLPPRLAEQLVAAGHPSVHVFDVLSRMATDVDVAVYANESGSVVMSKDSDFLDLVARGFLLTGVVWIRSVNVGVGALWSRVGPALPAISAAFDAGERIIELR